MDIFATPVRRDHFIYHNELLVDPGNRKQYRRAPTSELSALLKPTAASSSTKDETAHFYEAQLVHYGLPRTKDKARAKWRLLEALDHNSLSVPADVAKIEGQLKKEYNAGCKKQKSAALVQSSGAAAVNQATNVNVNVSVSVSDGGSKKRKANETPAGGSKTKKTKTSSPKKPASSENKLNTKLPSTQKPTKTATTTTSPWTVKKPQTARATRGAGSTATSTRTPTAAPSDEAPRKKQTARCNRGGMHASPSTRPTPAWNADAPSKSPLPKQTARRSVVAGPYPSLPREEVKPKSEGRLQVSGRYQIQIPVNSNLSLIIARDTYVIWGAFKLGFYEGFLKAQQVNANGFGGADFQLEWRGQELGGDLPCGGAGGFCVEPSGALAGSIAGVDVRGKREPWSEMDLGPSDVMCMETEYENMGYGPGFEDENEDDDVEMCWG